MSSDVKAIRLAATGSAGVGPARIRGVHVLVGAGTGRLTITDGAGGATVFDAEFDASDTSFVGIPDKGIRCESGIEVTVLTNITSITLLYS